MPIPQNCPPILCADDRKSCRLFAASFTGLRTCQRSHIPQCAVIVAKTISSLKIQLSGRSYPPLCPKGLSLHGILASILLEGFHYCEGVWPYDAKLWRVTSHFISFIAYSLQPFFLFPLKVMLGLVVLSLCIAQCAVSPAAAAVSAPSASITHLIMPTADAPLAAESAQDYIAEATADLVPELPGWGKLDFDLYSGYASRCFVPCSYSPVVGHPASVCAEQMFMVPMNLALCPLLPSSLA